MPFIFLHISYITSNLEWRQCFLFSCGLTHVSWHFCPHTGVSALPLVGGQTCWVVYVVTSSRRCRWNQIQIVRTMERNERHKQHLHPENPWNGTNPQQQVALSPQQVPGRKPWNQSNQRSPSPIRSNKAMWTRNMNQEKQHLGISWVSGIDTLRFP